MRTNSPAHNYLTGYYDSHSQELEFWQSQQLLPMIRTRSQMTKSPQKKGSKRYGNEHRRSSTDRPDLEPQALSP